MRARTLATALLALCGCATFSPTHRGLWIAPGAGAEPVDAPAAVALIGDIGKPRRSTQALVTRLARRLADAPDAPVVVLGDLFYGVGLVGDCPPGSGESKRRCAQAGPPELQLQTVLGPYKRALGSNPLIAVAGNHDHYADPRGTSNACALVPRAAKGWRYLARGCGLEEDHPVETLDLGDVVVFLMDSQPMINDRGYRSAVATALAGELERVRRERPDAWRIVAMHHPVESYGSHNGAALPNAVQKDLYLVRQTLLLPIAFPLDLWLGEQDLYQLGYRSYRRALYHVFAEHPIDAVASGHDHSQQHIEIEHAGVGHQLVSGSGAQKSRIKRLGLDLLWTNRLARGIGLGDALPAPRHSLRFGLGRSDPNARLSGYGFMVLVPSGDELVVEFHDSASDEPMYVTRIRR